MKKALIFITLTFIFLFSSVVSSSASSSVYTVIKGDSLWKIAAKHQVGLSEIKSANPQIITPDLIYPGDKITIPSYDKNVIAYEKEVVRLVNEIRRENGLNELTYDWELSRVARFKSQDMKDNSYFSHNSPKYGTPFQMMKNFGINYRSAAENIAKGYATPQDVVKGWMNSPGHRQNILNPKFTHIGVGYVPEGKYWTQMFIFK